MKVRIRVDSVEIEGYVNAVERESKPLWSRMGKFIEKIAKGAFRRAIERNDSIDMLLNHDDTRKLANTREGTLKLKEDNIGLHARATVTDKEVIEKAKRGELVGWSFGFTDRPDGVMKRIIDGMLHRTVNDMNLYEVSILDNTKTPAYDGTLVTARSVDGEMQFRSEPFIDDVETEKEETEERTEPKQQEVEKIDYSEYEKFLIENKEDN